MSTNARKKKNALNCEYIDKIIDVYVTTPIKTLSIIKTWASSVDIVRGVCDGGDGSESANVLVLYFGACNALMFLIQL